MGDVGFAWADGGVMVRTLDLR